MDEGVVLLHGIFCSRWQMRKLARFLEKSGYKVLNLTYPSIRMPLEDIARNIHPHISAFAREVGGKLHFVGFSMGGLVIRAYLHRYKLERPRRVVMLGTPNHGSEMADLVRNRWLFRKAYGPAGQQLVTNFTGAAEIFGDVTYELGVIAGDCSIDPLAAYVMGKPNDGKVSVESTRLSGMKDHTVVRTWHTFFPRNRNAWNHTLHFLKEGRFATASGTDAA